jgi:single-strand DNA-binding protein
MSMNKVILNGRLTRDPEMKTLPGAGTKVCNFGMAMSSKYKNKDQQLVEETTFVDLAAFGRTGEVIEQYFHRGDGILIEGRLKLDQWEKDGQKRSKLSVVVQSFSFPEGKKSDQSGNSQTAGGGCAGDAEPGF